MIAPSPTPRRVTQPSWLDLRFVLGLMLVFGSVLLGARLVASANHSYRLLAPSHDLAAGTVLHPGDLTTVSAHVPDRRLYVSATTVLAGRQLTAAVRAGELLPASALTAAPMLTTVTVPFADAQAPDLRAGERIEVWLSAKTCASVVLLPDATVQDVSTSGGSFSSSDGQNVTLSLPPALADRVVTALAVDGGTLRAGILSGPSHATADLPTLDGCTSTVP